MRNHLKMSGLQTVGDGVLDVPAVQPTHLHIFRRNRNISKRVVQEADPYIWVLRHSNGTLL